MAGGTRERAPALVVWTMGGRVWIAIMAEDVTTTCGTQSKDKPD